MRWVAAKGRGIFEGDRCVRMLGVAIDITARKAADERLRELNEQLEARVRAEVANAVNESAGLGFPFNIRYAMAGWHLLFFDNRGFTPTPGLSPQAKRGQYLVDGGTHCAARHTPRNLLGAEIGSRYLQGGNLGDWYAPDLTPNLHSGLGNESEEGIVEYLRTGSNGVSVASGPMAEAVEHSFQHLTDEDLKFIATYLKALPPSRVACPTALAANTPAMQRGALRYEGQLLRMPRCPW